jgi:ADP-heptose:LPS heptosyltransferase
MRHVLVARLDNDGDVLLAGPAVRAVAAGADRVTMLCGPRGSGAAALLPGVDDIVTFRADWIDPHPQAITRDGMLSLVDRLASLAISEAIILTSFHQSPLPLALLLRMAAVPVIAAVSEDYPGSLLDVRHHVADDIHEVERSLSTVRTLGFELPPGDDGRLAVERGHADPPTHEPYVVVHPGASVPARAWSPSRNAELVSALTEDGWTVVVTGSPSEADLVAAVAGGATDRTRVIDLAGRTDLAGLADVLAGASAVVVGNTGPAHLAAAVGTPVVSLYAPTVPAVRWRPWNVPHALLGRQEIACAGCRARVCPIDPVDQPCLATVAVHDMVAAVNALARDREAVAR